MAINGVVELKGTKDGLILQILERQPIQIIMNEIEKKFLANAAFFKGASIAGVDGIILSDEDIEKIKKLFEEKLDIPVKSMDRYARKTFVSIDKEQVVKDISSGISKVKTDLHKKSSSTFDIITEEKPVPTGIFDGLEEGNTKFVRGTIRSGRSVEFTGNIIILGDVNPGAEIVAFGNVIVLGSLRGIVHAGANGNDNAYIVANKMLAKQLRISGMIMRAEDDSQITAIVPEMAYIKGETIVIEPFL